MAWDLIVMQTPEGAEGMDDLENFPPSPLGALEEVKSRLKNVMPGFHFEPEMAVLDCDQFSISVGFPEDAPILSLDISVTGRHCERAAPLVARIIDAFGVSALDTSSGRIICKEEDLFQSLKDYAH